MLGRSPAIGTPYNIHTETLPGVRFRRTTRSCPSAKTLGRAVQKQIRNSSSTVKSWKKIWLVWVGLLTVSSGLDAVIWTYFPDHKVVQKHRNIRVITQLPNSEQSYKGKVKTHKYINRQNQSTTGKL